MRLPRSLVWVAFALGALLLLAVIAIGGRRREAQGALDAALAHSPADEAWLAALPDPDPALRARLEALRKLAWPHSDIAVRGGYDWFLKGEPPYQGQRERHEAERPRVEVVSALLEEDGVCLSSAAFSRREEPGEAPVWVEPRMGNASVVCNAARWYGMEAMLAAGPLPSLDRLDRLAVALRPIGGLLDAMIALAVAEERDRTYARLALAGCLPGERVRRWLDEAPRARLVMRDALRAERLLYREPQIRELLAGARRAQESMYGTWVDPLERLEYEWFGREDCARALCALKTIEGYFAGAVGPPALTRVDEWQHALETRRANWHLGSQAALTWTVLCCRAQHRAIRLLVETARLGAPAPVDEAALAARLPGLEARLAAGPLDLRLAYEAMAQDRIRFYVRPDTPLPKHLEARRAAWLPAAAGPPTYRGERPRLRVGYGSEGVEAALSP